MRRKITEKAIQAFNNREDFKEGNTEVTNYDNVTRLELHGNCIATYRESIGLSISDGGYPISVTTKERLNGLDGVRVHTKAGTHYLNDKEWNGSSVILKEW